MKKITVLGLVLCFFSAKAHAVSEYVLVSNGGAQQKSVTTFTDELRDVDYGDTGPIILGQAADPKTAEWLWVPDMPNETAPSMRLRNTVTFSSGTLDASTTGSGTAKAHAYYSASIIASDGLYGLVVDSSQLTNGDATADTDWQTQTVHGYLIAPAEPVPHQLGINPIADNNGDKRIVATAKVAIDRNYRLASESAFQVSQITIPAMSISGTALTLSAP